MASIRRKLAAETPEEHAARIADRDRQLWEVAHAWGNIPLAERRALLRAAPELEVQYDGAGYGSWEAPDGGWRARARVVERDTRGFEVELCEPLRMGVGMALGNTPGTYEHHRAGYRMRFTNGGMHRDPPRTTFICVPAGWTPTPWPGRSKG